MTISLKTKLSAAISILLVLLVGGLGTLVLRQQEAELGVQVLQSASSTTQLITKPLGTAYQTFFASGFATFSAELSALRRLAPDVGSVRLVSYSGDVLFDASLERDTKLTSHAALNDPSLLARVQRVVPTIESTDGRVVERFGNLVPMSRLNPPPRIRTIVVPYLDENGQHPFSAVYTPSYAALDASIATARREGALATLFALIASLLVGQVLARRIVRPLADLTAGAKRISGGDLDHRIILRSRDELGVLGAAFNQMATDLKASITKLVAGEKLRRELELAASIQRDLLPKSLPSLPGLEIVARTFPADEVGGDSYDVLPLADGRTVFYIGDVTGHGLPAALVMAIANALVASEAPKTPSTRELVIEVNRTMKAKTPANVFMTMTLLQWEADARRLTFTGAGHDDLLVHRAATGTIERIRPGGMILGALPDISAVTKTQALPLAPGDTIVLSTDGIVEALSPSGELYGPARFHASIRAHAALPLPQLFDALLRDAAGFMAGTPQSDDITLILLRRTAD